MVRSPPFQGGSTGSNPVGITSRHRFTMPFFCSLHSLALLLLGKLVLKIFMEQHLKQGRERFGLIISINTFVLMILIISLFGCRSSEPMSEPGEISPAGQKLAERSAFLREHSFLLTSPFAPLIDPLLDAGMDTLSLLTFLKDPKLKFEENLVKINVTGYRKKVDYSHNYSPKAIASSIAFHKEHVAILKDAEKKYGVPSEVITSILWVETKFGSYTGKYYVPSVFFTIALAAEPENIEKNKQALRAENPPPDASELDSLDKRIIARAQKKAKWAFGEILALDTIRKLYHKDYTSLYGSTAGAFGWSQFLPSSYVRWSVDGDSDGDRDLFSSHDAIHSIANYLKINGWGPEVKDHEKAVYHYNNSNDYVNAVLTLARKIKEGL
jgi:membrane-bound lytic murein transglycosylase B